MTNKIITKVLAEFTLPSLVRASYKKNKIADMGQPKGENIVLYGSS
jgi:hypothetical protein